MQCFTSTTAVLFLIKNECLVEMAEIHCRLDNLALEYSATTHHSMEEQSTVY